MSSFNRELFSATSDFASITGGAKKRHSKKSSNKSSKKNMKRSEMMGGVKKSSKKNSKKSSKKGGVKQAREMPQFMKNMLEVKKEVNAKHPDVKYGPPLIKVISEALKSKGSVDKAVEHINSMSTSELKSKLDKIAEEIKEKRASKKASKQASKQERPKQSREMPQFMKDMLEVKKEVTSKHDGVKYGPPLIKVISEALKSKGSVDKAVEHINSMSTSELKSKLDKIAQEIKEKRAAKKSA